MTEVLPVSYAPGARTPGVAGFLKSFGTWSKGWPCTVRHRT
ncbi:hypothetical protein ACWCQZ_47135 [Streptomyces sp. NPDC002285]